MFRALRFAIGLEQYVVGQHFGVWILQGTLRSLAMLYSPGKSANEFDVNSDVVASSRAGSLEEQQIFKTAGCLIHGELLPLPSFRIAMHHGFVFLFYFFSFPKCPVEDGVQRNSAALENGGKSAPRPILMFIRVSCVFGPDHKQNT